MRLGRFLLASLLVMGILLGPSQEQGRLAGAKELAASRTRPRPVLKQEKKMSGLVYSLKEGEALQPARTERPRAAAKPLTEPEVKQVLDRLPEFKIKPAVRELVLPPESPPPPRPGQTIKEVFPPTEEAIPPETTPAGPVQVIRRSPEGPVPLAANLSLTFSRPMVALSAQADLPASAVPVKLSPQPAGAWRWVGTKTLFFEPEDRFPMATDFKVEVPAGTASADGGRLEQAVTWRFTTPPPQIRTGYPTGGPHRLDPVLFASFNQRIEPAAVLATIKVRAAGKDWPVRLAEPAESEADDRVAGLASQAGEGRWLAFKTRDKLPAGAKVTVQIGPDTPSAEGPLRTKEAQKFEFKTYGPLKVTDKHCGYGRECPPLSPWYISFTNPLDESAFDPSLVSVEPDLPGAKIEVSHQTINIQGRSQGRTQYRIKLKPELKDVFGQTLGREETLTFEVGSARPLLFVPGDGFAVLEPSPRPAFSVFTINHEKIKVRLHQVQPGDFEAYLILLNDRRRQEPLRMPGRLVEEKTVRVKSEPDQMAETAIDLGPALENGFGQVIVAVEEADGRSILDPDRPRDELVRYTWVQSTSIGLDAFADKGELLVWANSLKDGAPLAGVEISLGEESQAVKTGPDGLARLPLPEKKQARVLSARLGQDTAVLRKERSFWRDWGWKREEVLDSQRWYVFDDRQMYRPGEEVHVKGWIRRVGGARDGDVGPLSGSNRELSYQVVESRGNEVAKGQARINAWGGFDLVVRLPEKINLGQARLNLSAPWPGPIDGWSYVHTFQVQEFRRPEFEVSASAGEGPFLVGGFAPVQVSARYYAGGALANAEVAWQVSARTGHFSPPGWSGFAFGEWTPWWWDVTEPQDESVKTYNGLTDGSGVHRLRLDFESARPPRPAAVTAQASVMDVNRQAWTASTHLLVHPALHYVGLRGDRTFVQPGQPLKIEVVVTDLEGRPMSGRTISLKAVRLDWTHKKGVWRQEETDAGAVTLTSAAKPVQHEFKFTDGGMYKLTAAIQDLEGRPNQTVITRWVSGGQRPPARKVEQEKVELIPDRQEYKPGETAEIMLSAPFWPAEGLVTWRRSGLAYSERFTLTGPTQTLKVPVQEHHIPNLHVQVDLVGAAVRTDDLGRPDDRLPKRPAYAKGGINLRVPPLSRGLSLKTTPRDQKLEPGGRTWVDLELRDAAGRAVPNGEVALVVVDEAILALTGYTLDDPLEVFYQSRPAGVSDHHSRADILLVSLDQLARQAEEAARERRYKMAEAGADLMLKGAKAPPMPMAAAPPGAGAAPEPIKVRADFRALAVFTPSVITDANGRAQVEVKLPDSLTRYRVMAVAVAGGKQFGLGESAITARLPLMVRPSPPRFLNFGDRFELPVSLQNQTSQPLVVDVALKAANASLTAGAGRRVTVPADDRVEVRFPAATVAAGEAGFQITAVAGRYADAAEARFPVYTPATSEAAAVYGQIDQGAEAQPIAAPADVFKEFGGLEITTSSTALQALTDAVLYLVSYPFECSEQLASRVLAVAALKDVLAAFKAEGLPGPEEITKAVARDIERLKGMQNDDGGFPVWRRGQESWPYHSIHAVHALVRAKAKGFDVPQEMLRAGQHYLQNIEKRIPARYGDQARYTLTAYALYVRNLMGDRDVRKAKDLLRKPGLDKLNVEAAGWLLSVLTGQAAAREELDDLRRYLNNRVTETAGAAGFVTAYGDNGYLLLHSDRRTDGVVLEALIKDQPKSDLIPKLVRGLMAHRKKGRWSGTQENAFILLALDKYFQTYEAVEPNFVARAWLGDRYVGRAGFKGRTADYRQIEVPMSYLAGKGRRDVILSKDGPGRLYYRLGLRYAPRDLNLGPADRGFTVRRVYEGVDDPKDVTRATDGAWRIKAGARVKVTLTLAAEARRYHVALIDPLPAGLEALNPALAVTGSLPRTEDPGSRRYWWWGPWYEHQNLRDDRAEAFASLLWEGVYTYTYVARATTPGQFVVPPAKAEEMYSPETFGRSGVDRVIVE
ncbi:MAG: alpha-2-macroglobulin family protein [Thermodesulfobacteriota bacterium]